MNDFMLNKYSKISIIWRSIIIQLQLEHKLKALKLLKILHTIKIDTTKFMHKSLLFLNLYYKNLKKTNNGGLEEQIKKYCWCSPKACPLQITALPSGGGEQPPRYHALLTLRQHPNSPP